MKTKTAITLTEYRMGGSGMPESFRRVTVPVSRIARSDGHPIGTKQATKYGSQVTLRTPEDYIFTVETPEEIANMIND